MAPAPACLPAVGAATRLKWAASFSSIARCMRRSDASRYLLDLSRCRSIKQNGQQQRRNGEDAGIADDSNVAQLHVAGDDSAQPGKGERAAGNEKHANRRSEAIPAEYRRGGKDEQSKEHGPDSRHYSETASATSKGKSHAQPP